jgi:hypothetical protein
VIWDNRHSTPGIYFDDWADVAETVCVLFGRAGRNGSLSVYYYGIKLRYWNPAQISHREVATAVGGYFQLSLDG